MTWATLAGVSLIVWAALFLVPAVGWSYPEFVPAWLDGLLASGSAVALVAGIWLAVGMPPVPTVAWAIPMYLFQVLIIEVSEPSSGARYAGVVVLMAVLAALMLSRRAANWWCTSISELARSR